LSLQTSRHSVAHAASHSNVHAALYPTELLQHSLITRYYNRRANQHNEACLNCSLQPEEFHVTYNHQTQTNSHYWPNRILRQPVILVSGNAF
jgi:hypothetical protein